MKLLTTNFLTCAVKSCKTSPASFPLHFRDATLEKLSLEFNPLFMRNIVPRLNWEAVRTAAIELGLEGLVPGEDEVGLVDSSRAVAKGKGDGDADGDGDGDGGMDVEIPSGGEEQVDQKKDEVLKRLHALLLETGVVEGKLVCGNCGFEYPIKDGVGNFLLPAHLV